MGVQGMNARTLARTELARAVPISPVVLLDKRVFGRLKPETVQEERKPLAVTESSSLKPLIELWNKHELMLGDEAWNYDEYYEKLSKELKDISYTAKEVEIFCAIQLIVLREEKSSGSPFRLKAGIFLSALVNNGKDEDYKLQLSQLDEPLKYLGFQNQKNITIIGTVGHGCADHMKCGNIVVFGDVEGELGHFMKGGTVLIKGNAIKSQTASIGSAMVGGKIIVEGNAEHGVGFGMDGGEIMIHGNVGTNLGYHMTDGSIWVKGNVKGDTVQQMEGGTITIEGNLTGALARAKFYGKGKVYLNGEFNYDLESALRWGMWFCADIYHKGTLIAHAGKTFNCYESICWMGKKRGGRYD